MQTAESFRSLGILALAIVTSALVAAMAHANEKVAFRPLILQGNSVKWESDPSTGVRLRYAFVSRPVVTPDARNCSEIAPFSRLLHVSALDIAKLRNAFALAAERWQRVANVDFVETADQGVADILIGEQMQPIGRAFANVSLRNPRPGARSAIARSIVCLNPAQRWKFGFDGNLEVYDLVHTFTHEIGHAIGLDHPLGSGHLMSPRYDESIVDLTPGDIAGAVALYGRRRDLRGATSQASAPIADAAMP